MYIRLIGNKNTEQAVVNSILQILAMNQIGLPKAAWDNTILATPEKFIKSLLH
jgi:hypothetical protein